MKNISPEIEAAIAEGREMGLREAAAYVRGIKDTYVPYVLRGLDSAFHDKEGPDGWAEISGSAKRMLGAAARGILRLVNDDPIPEHVHVWSEQSNGESVCAICGEVTAASRAAAPVKPEEG